MPPYTLKVDPEMVFWKHDKTDDFAATYQKTFTSYKANNDVRTVREIESAGGTGSNYANIDSLSMGKEVRSVEGLAHVRTGGPGTSNSIMQLHDEFIEFRDKASRRQVYDVTSIKHDHIPAITYFKPSTVLVRDIQTATYNKRIGYIIGAGDKVPEALEQMGYDVTLLTEKELSRNNLQQFDAIITGVRAYNTNDWLNKYYDRLMKYVNDGGNFIVQYNNTQFRNGQPKIGPYTFTIANRRITDENADVVFLKPDHPVLNFPNKITQEDFKGWIQERSIYHATNFDKNNFETIFSMHDPGEQSDEGSLVIAKYGKGYFTYTGLVFFRELPAGVPGAYRLLANIIALNKKKAF
jgi:hypothetical protein